VRESPGGRASVTLPAGSRERADDEDLELIDTLATATTSSQRMTMAMMQKTRAATKTKLPYYSSERWTRQR
jgi:hypothetical protein